jgi:hypothetical protein
MHTIHHVLGFMQTRNFNLTFPICDALFGTSDLDRGLVHGSEQPRGSEPLRCNERHSFKTRAMPFTAAVGAARCILYLQFY